MTFLQAILIAILQGATELFPISSLGHAVILPRLLGWAIDEKSETFLPFLVVLHLGTATALFLYFWKDWIGFVKGVLGKGKPATVRSERRTFYLVCAATVPGALLGKLLEHPLRELFSSPLIAAFFLIVNGGVLFVGEKLRKRRKGMKSVADLDTKTALVIGSCQALALVPGISRSGMTMVGGLLAGLTHKEAARFSFLLATPIIAGAGVLEIPKLLKLHDVINEQGSTMLIAGVIAGVIAWLSTWALMRYFKQTEVEALNPFAFYCWAAGLGSLIYMLTM